MPQDRVVESQEVAQRLIEFLRPLESVVVAFSGGVDSAVVARAASLALPTKSIAVTGVGAAVSQRDREDALAVAQQIGIPHLFLNTEEIDDPEYVANDRRRCFYCKQHLYRTLQQWSREQSFQHILSGTNLDDLHDYRPGLEAARQFGVVAPLVEVKIDKGQVRNLARLWGISIASKPASPCLASRIAYGEPVDRNRLRMIEAAEAYLRTLSVSDVRVRWYPKTRARIEVPIEEMSMIASPKVFDAITKELQSLGFEEVELEPSGLVSGRLNRLLPILDHSASGTP